MKTINVDEADELTIRCKQKRSFNLAVNLNRDLSGKAYKLQATTTPGLTFDSGNGLSVQGTSIVLTKTPQEMDVPTGAYRYDLVELSGDNADNIFYGWFIIEPSISAL